jgi:negative regulator of replication initiation
MNSDNDEYISVSDLRKRLKSFDPSQRSKLTDIIENILKKPLIIPDSDLTHTKVRGFKLRDHFYEANSHIDVFRKVLQIITHDFPGEEQKLLSICGRKRKYFSQHFDDLRMPERISGTDIYFETNENAISLQVRCENVLKHYEMDYLSFEIVFYR